MVRKKSAAPSPRVEPGEKAWRAMYHRLVDFHRERHHCDVPAGQPLFRPLAAWLTTQREHHAQGRLLPARHEALTELGVDFTPDGHGEKPDRMQQVRDRAWERRFAALVRFQRRFGHTRVPARWEEDTPLGMWVFQQRKQFRTGAISPRRAARLTAIGFEWECAEFGGLTRLAHFDALFDQRFAELAAFKRCYGHCRVPSTWNENPALARWVSKVRERRRDGELTRARIRQFKALGFDWAPGDIFRHEAWDLRFEELQVFQSRFGHTCVPAAWKENPTLGAWVYQQRKQRRTGKLAADRIARLDAIGFQWGMPEFGGRSRTNYLTELWEQRFSELRAFQKRFGHCLVPSLWKENPALGKWVSKLREARHKGTLAEARAQRLEALGFAWKSPCLYRSILWERRYEDLVAFQRRFGHTRVPSRWPENEPLPAWNYQQRKLQRLGKLPPDRKARLDALGFEWAE